MTMTVSYTHLDVYKRQVYENLEHKVVIDTLGASPARILLSDGTGGYGFENLQLVVRENGLYPVSYTHLCV